MSRPANPYDNASWEIFMKMLKREEIYANKYDDLENLPANIEEFIRTVLQSAAVALGAGLSISRRVRATDRGVRFGRISKRNDVFFENEQNDERASTRLLGTHPNNNTTVSMLGAGHTLVVRCRLPGDPKRKFRLKAAFRVDLTG